MSVTRDLERRHEAIDAWDAYLTDDTRLATWAHATVDEPETERDLGRLADWAADVTERRAS